MCPGIDGHGGDDGVDLVKSGPLLLDVAPSGSVMASSFLCPLVPDLGTPNRGDHEVPADVDGEDSLVLSGWPDKGVPVTDLPLPTARLLFSGLA